MIVAERGWAEKNGLKPMARLVAYGIGAVEPGFFGIGPGARGAAGAGRAPAGRSATCERVEINEAFAAIALACLRELGFAEDVVNVEGGAIAHGHPIGASGAVLTTRLLHSMKRDGLQARHRHAVHRRRAGHRAGARNDVSDGCRAGGSERCGPLASEPAPAARPRWVSNRN